jgi:hypothetical protein
MNRYSLVAIFLLLNSTLAAAASSEDLLKARLEGRYKELKGAMASGDVASIKVILAPGFVSEDVSGNKEDADAMLREVSALQKDPNKVSETTVVSVDRNADTAVAVQRYHMTTSKPTQDGSSKQVDLVTVSKDTWKLVANGSWLISSTITQQLDYKVNGNLVAHKEHAPQ